MSAHAQATTAVDHHPRTRSARANSLPPGPSSRLPAAREGLSLEALFHTYRAKLCTFALGYVGCTDVAEEVVEDVFLRLWEQRENLPKCNSPKSYLYTAVRNQALKHLAHERVVRKSLAIVQREGHAPGMSQPPASAEDQVQATELAAAFQYAIEQLPARCREAYTLHRQHGLSYAAIAERMGVSVRTVDTQLARATKVLRRNLAAWLP